MVIAKTLSACIKQLLQSAGPRLASDIASSPPLLLCTRTCVNRTAKNLFTFCVGGPALCEGDLNSQVLVVASALLSPNQKASIRLDLTISEVSIFTSTPSLYPYRLQTKYEYGNFKYK